MSRVEFNNWMRQLLDEVRKNKSQSQEIQNDLFKYGILKGYTQRIISNKIELSEVDTSVLILIALQLNIMFTEESIDVHQYFDNRAIELAKQLKPSVSDNIKLPLTLSPALLVAQDKYITTISVKQIHDLMEANILTYDYSTQRNPRYEKRKDGTVRMVPNIYEKHVKEMEKLMLDGKLESTMITFNVVAGTSIQADDMYFNSSNMSLTINEGSEITILDGYHRIVASLRALAKNPELDFTFGLTIVNYNTRRAQELVAQINTVYPMDKAHLVALKESRWSDSVVKELQFDSELSGKISQATNVTKLAGHIVSFSTLSDAIDEEFKIENKKESIEVSRYLKEFFNELIMNHEDEFNKNVNYWRNISLINANVMFVGYVVLAAKMRNEEISITELENILSKIDFNRTNSLWKEIGVVNENGAITNQAVKSVKKYFRQLNL